MNELWALPFDMAEPVLAELASAKSNPQALVEGFPERKARGYEPVSYTHLTLPTNSRV